MRTNWNRGLHVLASIAALLFPVVTLGQQQQLIVLDQTALRPIDPSRAANNAERDYLQGLAAYVKRNFPAAKEAFERAALQGERDAEAYLGLMYDFGYGVSSNEATARSWYTRAARHGQSDAMVLLARNFEHNKDYDQALLFLHRAADLGNATAELDLGTAYFRGQGLPADPVEAAKWWQQSADQLQDGAEWLLAQLYESGTGVPKDEDRALHYYCDAVYQGLPETSAWNNTRFSFDCHTVNPAQQSPEADWQMGNRALADKYYSEAAAWFQRSLDGGFLRARPDLARLYYDGIGVKQDYAKAFELFKAAAQAGDATSQTYLGRMFIKGDGTDKDLKAAKKWLTSASKQGDAGARAALHELTGNSKRIELALMLLTGLGALCVIADFLLSRDRRNRMNAAVRRFWDWLQRERLDRVGFELVGTIYSWISLRVGSVGSIRFWRTYLVYIGVIEILFVLLMIFFFFPNSFAAAALRTVVPAAGLLIFFTAWIPLAAFPVLFRRLGSFDFSLRSVLSFFFRNLLIGALGLVVTAAVVTAYKPLGLYVGSFFPQVEPPQLFPASQVPSSAIGEGLIELVSQAARVSVEYQITLSVTLLALAANLIASLFPFCVGVITVFFLFLAKISRVIVQPVLGLVLLRLSEYDKGVLVAVGIILSGLSEGLRAVLKYLNVIV